MEYEIFMFDLDNADQFLTFCAQKDKATMSHDYYMEHLAMYNMMKQAFVTGIIELGKTIRADLEFNKPTGEVG
jgi:hypothetical protein